LGALLDVAGTAGEAARQGVRAGVLGVCGAVAMMGAMETSQGPATALRPLPAEDRAAMEWAARMTPAGARFAVVPSTGWWVDATSEWFPALAERESVATPQGYEWVEGAFAERLELHGALAGCRDADAACLAGALEGREVTHVLVPSGCCGALNTSLRASPDWAVLYDAGGALIVGSVDRPTGAPFRGRHGWRREDHPMPGDCEIDCRSCETHSTPSSVRGGVLSGPLRDESGGTVCVAPTTTTATSSP
jgi:hypothetical protein